MFFPLCRRDEGESSKASSRVSIFSFETSSSSSELANLISDEDREYDADDAALDLKLQGNNYWNSSQLSTTVFPYKYIQTS